MGNKTYRRWISFIMTVAMVFGMSPSGLVLAAGTSDTPVSTQSTGSKEDMSEETTTAMETEEELEVLEEEESTSTVEESTTEEEKNTGNKIQTSSSVGENTGNKIQTGSSAGKSSGNKIQADSSTGESTVEASESEEESEDYKAVSLVYDANGFCTSYGETYYQPAVDSDADGYYEISNAGQLFWFASLVNGDTAQEGITGKDTSANAILTADINLNPDVDTLGDSDTREWEPIESYAGTFDGDGYTISGLYINEVSTNDSNIGNQGLFGRISSGGTVKNVTVDGHILVEGISSNYLYYIGGVAGYNEGTVDGCISKCTISANEDTRDVGGIVGYNRATVSNCLNTGTIKGDSYVGGVVGQGNHGSTLKNSCNIGDVSGENHVGNIIGYVATDNDTVTNCYCLNTSNNSGIGTGSGSTTSKTTDAFASGEVAYLLNESVSGGSSWYQNLDNGKTIDSYPLPNAAHGTVYKCSTCAGAVTYSNKEGITAVHSYDSETGFCKVCGAYEPADYNEEDSVYEISNTGQFFWFASLVNGTTTISYENAEISLEGITEAVSNANAVLTCDIDLSVTTDTHTDTEWTPIGLDTNGITNQPAMYYNGTFDGQGYTISGLTIDTEERDQGLFGYVRGGTIKNFNLEDVDITAGEVSGIVVSEIYQGTVSNVNVLSGSLNVSGGYSGGIAAVARTGSKISECYNAASITSSSSIVGGIVGNMRYNDTTIKNCYNIGTIFGTTTIGGLAGSITNGGDCAIVNSYNIGTVTATDSNGICGGIIGNLDSSYGHITNSYYLDTIASSDIGTGGTESDETTSFSSEELSSGEITYLLQGTQESMIWGQTLTGSEADEYPVLTSEESKQVIKINFILVEEEETSDLTASYLNKGQSLAAYPKCEDSHGEYVFYSDEACTDAIDTENATYDEDTIVYIAVVYETFTVYYGEESVAIEIKDGETYDLTQGYDEELGYGVPSGYLYGGLYRDEDYEDAYVIGDSDFVEAMNVAPEKGDIYYVRLVDDAYFQIICLVAYKHYIPTNLWLVTNVDSDVYLGYGFDVNCGENINTVVTKEAVKQMMQTIDVDGKIYTGTIDISNFDEFSDGDYDENDLETNLVGYYDITDIMDDILDQGNIVITPFFITQDGMKVTGTIQKTMTLSSNTLSASEMYVYVDEDVTSIVSAISDIEEINDIISSSSLTVSQNVLITNIDNTYTSVDSEYSSDIYSRFNQYFGNLVSIFAKIKNVLSQLEILWVL